MTVGVEPIGFGAGMMSFQPNPEAIPFGIAVAVSAGLAAMAWRHREMPLGARRSRR